MDKLGKRMPLFESVGNNNAGTEFVQGLTEAGKLPAEDKDFLKGLFGGEHGNEMRELSADDRSKLGVIFGKIREEEDAEIPAEAEAMLEEETEELVENETRAKLDKIVDGIEDVLATENLEPKQHNSLSEALALINSTKRRV